MAQNESQVTSFLQQNVSSVTITYILLFYTKFSFQNFKTVFEMHPYQTCYTLYRMQLIDQLNFT